MEKAEPGVGDGIFGACVEEPDGAVTGLRTGAGRRRRADHLGDSCG
ncbi:hypothetical protein [Streptosporangium roseum]|uniref:Uncharacterized protein n=1 Tax=Streptosporangium roseum (strain ATCC 12428 / DSM 43021 / JCM 3005 / KCTC 9067 / NCIMB 10171 / NRRL 2505 / NI 9100) TaxID=479432 RepID=D2AT51_STRRD|nr:hypothetical protein [Streptosporangium roseum]ACZ84727.1 hypothetical protein Sros_1736 [Streptosporangium roseum DSM 43021]